MRNDEKITAAPLLSPRPFLPGTKKEAPGALADRSVRFFFSGSHAVWNGIRALKLRSDQKILFPSYHCGAELDAVLKAGYSVQFYRVDDRLRIDFDSVARQMDGAAGALFLIHYFGFPQPIDEVLAFCRERSLVMIEDCAHALYSVYRNRPLGTFGEMSIFSLRKYLPVPEGGALRMNGGASLPEEAPSPPGRETLGTLKREIERTLRLRAGMAGRVLLNLERSAVAFLKRGAGLNGGGLPKSLDPSIYFSVEHGHWGISSLTRRIVSGTDHTAVIRRRSENFKRLAVTLRSCRTVRLMFDELPEGVCPWMFPIRVGNPSSLIAHLQSGGMEVAPFWNERHPAFPAHLFPEVGLLRDQVVALPIHQDLDDNLMIALSERVHSWKP